MMTSKKQKFTERRTATIKLLCCLTVLLGAFCLSGAEFAFAENGKAQCLIALPDKPAGFDRDAADDLSSYLGKMTGAKFAVVPESKVPAGKNVIYVGQTDFARKQNICFDQLSAEEWVIKTAGNNLILSGGKPIGSFYAVWTLLNKFGCYCLTWDQDAIPNYKTLKREIQPEQNKPAFNGRFIYNRYPPILNHTRAAAQVKHVLQYLTLVV